MMHTYIRNENIEFRQLDDTLFLIDNDANALFYLDSISAGIWNILDKPTSSKEIIELISRAFPERASIGIAQDIHTLFRRLIKKGLIRQSLG